MESIVGIPGTLPVPCVRFPVQRDFVNVTASDDPCSQISDDFYRDTTRLYCVFTANYTLPLIVTVDQYTDRRC